MMPSDQAPVPNARFNAAPGLHSLLPLQYEHLALPSEVLYLVRTTPEEATNVAKLYDAARKLRSVAAIEQKFITVKREEKGEVKIGDFNTLVHMGRVAIASTLVAGRLGYKEADLMLLMIGALVHDTGKLDDVIQALAAVPKLDLQQRALMDTHAERGLKYTEVLALGAAVAGMAGCHHLYSRRRPYGAALPLEGRRIDLEMILGTVDAFDGMTAIREYRINDPDRPNSYSIPAAIATLRHPTEGQRVDSRIIDELGRLYDIEPPEPMTRLAA